MKFGAVFLFATVGFAQVRSIFAQETPQGAVLVQLFTSEGCSSCPPADRLLSELAKAGKLNDATIIPMSLHVDYWNQLGWRDPFSAAQFSQLQADYQRVLKNDAIYTPQMIVDGRAEFVGSDRESAAKAISAAAQLPKASVSIQIARHADDESKLQVKLEIQHREAIPANEPFDLLLAVTEDDLTSQVSRGENANQTLHHTSVVRSLQKIDDTAGSGYTKPIEVALKLDRMWKRDNLHIVAIVQSKRTLRVYGAATALVPPLEEH